MTAPSLLDVVQVALFIPGMFAGWVVRAVYEETHK